VLAVSNLRELFHHPYATLVQDDIEVSLRPALIGGLAASDCVNAQSAIAPAWLRSAPLTRLRVARDFGASRCFCFNRDDRLDRAPRHS